MELTPAQIVQRVEAFRARPAAERDTGEAVAALYNELTGLSVRCTGCNYRAMLYEINQLYNRAKAPYSPGPMSATATKIRFKDAYKDVKVAVTNGDTRVITATNLTDHDEQVLRDQGFGHVIEKIPAKEQNEASSSKKKEESAAK